MARGLCSGSLGRCEESECGVHSWEGTGGCIFAGGIKRLGIVTGEKGLVMCLGLGKKLAQDCRMKEGRYPCKRQRECVKTAGCAGS